jgi:hypothetical protein
LNQKIHAPYDIKEFSKFKKTAPSFPMVFYYDNGEYYSIKHCRATDFNEEIKHLKKHKFKNFTWGYSNDDTLAFRYFKIYYDSKNCSRF